MSEQHQSNGSSATGADRGRKPRLLFVVNSDWFFLSHRLALAEWARDQGFDVQVAAVETGQGKTIQSHGFLFHPLRMSRNSVHPVREIASVLSLLRLYRKCRPDIVHHVTPKPVLYGSLAARLVPETAVVNAVTGLGYVFTNEGQNAFLRRLVTRMYRAALSHPASRVIFQNRDDHGEFIRFGLVSAERTELIRGAGVDCARFAPLAAPEGPPIVMLVGRMLWDKGVGEFVGAARLMRSSGVNARWVLVGGPDPGNPASIPEEQLRSWVASGDVEWWGHQTAIPELLAAACVVVLPSYREGLPKALLEGAACGRPLVAADVPGCREVVRHGVNGFLVPAREVGPLADAVQTLLGSPDLRARFGSASRDIAVNEFADRIIYEATLDVYRRLLAEQRPRPSDPERRTPARRPAHRGRPSSHPVSI